jgi:hypothetical protein
MAEKKRWTLNIQQVSDAYFIYSSSTGFDRAALFKLVNTQNGGLRARPAHTYKCLHYYVCLEKICEKSQFGENPWTYNKALVKHRP